MDEHRKNFIKEVENIGRYQTEATELMNISELKLTLRGFKRRLDEAEEMISKLEDRIVDLPK